MSFKFIDKEELLPIEKIGVEKESCIAVYRETRVLERTDMVSLKGHGYHRKNQVSLSDGSMVEYVWMRNH